MTKIRKLTQITSNKFLNFFEMVAENREGNPFPYFMASRAKTEDELMLVNGKLRAHGVNICSIVKTEEGEKLVLIKQYRYPIGERVYEFPAGLVEEGENPREAAVRELFEETGLSLEPVQMPEGYERPFFNSCGMTDEANVTIFGYASGTVTTENIEASEDLEVIMADRNEAKRILKEERIALNCAYMLMHFASSKEGEFII